MAALTGERHVHAESNLDVVIGVTNLGGALRTVAFLARAEQDLPFRIDGELSFPDLGEVPWRELLQDRDEILLKSVDILELMPRARLPR